MKPDLVPGTPAYEAYLASLTGPGIARKGRPQKPAASPPPADCGTCSHLRGNECAVLVATREDCPFHSIRQGQVRKGERWLGEMRDDEGTVGQR